MKTNSRTGRSLIAALRAVVAGLFIAVVASVGAQAQGGIGVGPTSISGTDILRGGQFRADLQLSNATASDATFRLTIEGTVGEWPHRFTDAETRSEDLAVFVMGATETVQVVVEVSVPEDVPNGTYSGLVKVESAEGGEIEGSGATVSNSIGVPIKLGVTGTQVRESTLIDSYVDPSEVGLPQTFTAKVRNSGNVRVDLRVDVEISRDGAVEETISSGDDALFPVIGGETGVVYVVWDTSEQRAGDFEAAFSVYDIAGDDELLIGTASVPFRLEPRGTLSRSGTFVELSLVNQPEVGRTARLEAQFENSGQIAVQSVFTGRILVDGVELSPVTSLPLMIAPSTSGWIDFSFPVDREGEYTVEGLVNYDGVQSETLSIKFVPDPAGTAAGGTSSGGEAAGGDDGGSSAVPIIIVVVVAAALVGGLLWLRGRRAGQEAAASPAEPADGSRGAQAEAEVHETV